MKSDRTVALQRAYLFLYDVARKRVEESLKVYKLATENLERALDDVDTMAPLAAQIREEARNDAERMARMKAS